MAGFTDANVVDIISNANLSLRIGTPASGKPFYGSSCFIMTAPNSTTMGTGASAAAGTEWPSSETVVELFNGSVFSTLTTTTEWQMPGDGYIYVKPNAILIWTQAAIVSGNWSLSFYRRPDSQQNYSGTGQNMFSAQAIAAQLDRSTRLAQIAMEAANRAIQVHPQDISFDPFTGKNLHPTKFTLPTSASRGGLALGFSSDGTTLTTVASIPVTPTAVGPTPSTVSLRDASGRSQFADPAASSDAATKNYVDITAGVSTNTNSTLVRRDGSGRSQFTDPSAAQDAATKNYVDSYVPIGAMMDWPANTVPNSNWAFCDGSAISRTTYSSAFAVLCKNKGTATVTIASPGVVTLNGHGFNTGESIYFTTTGALPTGLVANTLYYVIFVSANTFQLATTLANSKVPTPINTSGTQSGVHTLFHCPYGLGDGSTTFNLPDFKAAGRRMSGTSTKFTQNKTVGLGEVIDDAFQGHRHNPLSGAGIWTSAGATGGNKASTTTGTVDITTGDPVTDGTNGTPRIANETTGKSIGTNVIIRIT